MSSYLNIYLVPRTSEESKEKSKPLLFTSFSRSTDIYQTLNDSLNVTYIGNDDEPKYMELTSDKLLSVVADEKDELAKTEKQLELRVQAYKELAKKDINECVDDYVQTKQYIDEKKELISQLETLQMFVQDLQYSDFEKALINIS